MESSHVSGDAEECHSSESGWTMYIGSPIHGDDDDDDDDGNGNDNSVKPGEESDDSMASDASSGRSRHREHSWGSGKGMIGPGMADLFKHRVRKDEDDGKRCCFLRKKEAEDPVEKKGFERRKKEKGGSVFTAKGASVVVAAQITQSCEKEKKNSWFGKRK